LNIKPKKRGWARKDMKATGAHGEFLNRVVPNALAPLTGQALPKALASLTGQALTLFGDERI